VVDVTTLGGALQNLVGSGVRSGVRLISSCDLERLDPRERSFVESAVSSRQREFASGRALLHDVLGSSEPVLVTPTRAPLFPPGVVGSLAHDREVAVAIVGRSERARAVGVDVEPAVPLDQALVEIIVRDDDEVDDAHLAFTAKEAAYKAWSSMGGGILDHHDVRVRFDDDHFVATVLLAALELRGAWATVAGRHLAAVVVPADRGPS
jgi:4'-phosphopantetheinyl transferase EntD